MTPRFFLTPSAWRAWLTKHHAIAKEALVGFHKAASGKRSLTWPESVDEALCFGWIDGIRKRIDDESYTIRFTPRKPASVWSAVNIRRAEALAALGRMRPAGTKAFEARRENRSGIYSYEQRSPTLVDPYAARLKRNRKAWGYFQAQPPSYQKAVNWWVVSARREATRQRRLDSLIELSAEGRRIPQFTRR